MVKSQLIPPFQNLFQTPSKLLNQHQNLHVASLNPLCWMVKSHDSCCLNPLFFMVFCPYFFVDKNSSVYVIPHFCCLNSPFFWSPAPQLNTKTPGSPWVTGRLAAVLPQRPGDRRGSEAGQHVAVHAAAADAAGRGQLLLTPTPGRPGTPKKEVLGKM